MKQHELLYGIAKEHVIRASGLLSLLMPGTSGVGIGVKGLDGRYQLTNQAMESLIGRNAAQIVGMTDGDLFPPAIAARLQASDDQICSGAATASEELELLVNGIATKSLWLKFPVLGSDGRILSIGTVILNVSGQEAIAEMRQSMEQLRETNRELKKSLTEMDRLASTDKLTGAWNRRRLEEVVINEMDRLKRYDHPLSLLIIDIDLFKRINDQHGHTVGDQVLARLASVIQSSLRASDSLTRWGGEEFIVLSPNTTLSTVSMLAERLRERIATTEFQGIGQITVSIGAAECINGETWTAWFMRADSALYRAKACGRNQVQIAPETPARFGLGENVSAHFVQLAWHPAYESGCSQIDEQHKGLFSDANNLLAAILSGRPGDEIGALIDVLVRDAQRHFKDEEALIAAAAFPGAAEHAAMHGRLIDQAVVLVGRFSAGTLAIGDLFQFLAHDMIARHMLGADREFFPFLEPRRVAIVRMDDESPCP